jgi:hypothetical protein
MYLIILKGEESENSNTNSETNTSDSSLGSYRIRNIKLSDSSYGKYVITLDILSHLNIHSLTIFDLIGESPQNSAFFTPDSHMTSNTFIKKV